MEYAAYERAFVENLMKMSRTANQRVDTSASATKASVILIHSGEAAQQTALRNTARTLRFLYENRACVFAGSDALSELLLKVASAANQDIVKPGELFRSGEDSSVFPYARIRDIPALYQWFVRELFWRIATPEQDPVETSCFAEYLINFIGHFFSDGCGKISMLVSAYVLMRAELPLPHYDSRASYYAHAKGQNIPTREHIMDQALYESFLAYYRGLFQEEEQ